MWGRQEQVHKHDPNKATLNDDCGVGVFTVVGADSVAGTMCMQPSRRSFPDV